MEELLQGKQRRSLRERRDSITEIMRIDKERHLHRIAEALDLGLSADRGCDTIASEMEQLGLGTRRRKAGVYLARASHVPSALDYDPGTLLLELRA